MSGVARSHKSVSDVTPGRRDTARGWRDVRRYRVRTRPQGVPGHHLLTRARAFVMVLLWDLFPLHEAFGYKFHQEYEAVDRSGVKLYK